MRSAFSFLLMSATSPIESDSATLRQAAVRLVLRLQEAGFEAYFAGGCVRDRLLGRSPKDFDIATKAQPREVRSLFPNSGMVGAHFGVVLVHEPEGDFEIATFRSDGVYLDGRRPKDVRFSSAEEDAQRRDFTINGLFENPVTGELIDFVGGQADLRAGLIRAIGQPVDRFREDHLRLLRAVRFAANLGFELEPVTLAAVQQEASSIHQISAERVRDELERILENPRRLHGFDLLVGTGLLSEILPEVIDLCWCEPNSQSSQGDVFARCRRMLELLPADASLSLVLAVLLKDVAKPAVATRGPSGEILFPDAAKVSAQMAGEILRRLKFPNETIASVVEAVAHSPEFSEVRGMRLADLKRFMARLHFAEELEMHRVDCVASGASLENREFLLQRLEEFGGGPLIPPRILSGKDLLGRGWTSGPHLKAVLDAVQDEQLEGRLTTTEGAIEWLTAHFTPQ
jgi:poly(A) polymerase